MPQAAQTDKLKYRVDAELENSIGSDIYEILSLIEKKTSIVRIRFLNYAYCCLS